VRIGEHLFNSFIKVLQSLFIVLLVSLYLIFFILCHNPTHLSVRLYNTLKLNWSVHLKLVFELPLATNVKLFGECFFPVRQELLSFGITLAWIHNFVPFHLTTNRWLHYSRLLILSLIHYRILSFHNSLINYRLRCLKWWNLWLNRWQRIRTCILPWSRSASSRWNGHFFWVLSLALPFSSNRTWLSNTIIIHKRGDIRNGESSSSIGAKRRVWLFNSLFIPSY